ncbi:helix-turn-helix domain-containing protein [Ottowia thiooxydans]|uniref:helix-turn-helix domain-containing protein n=1 Tax=Ottowia thiooxydans TaxID=219182 RepID=UPI000688F1B0|nr:cupin domain-containing protein [Ottowia thiooxydans]
MISHPTTAASDQQHLDVLVGQKIRALRLARGMSLKDVATRARMSVGFLSQTERGLSSPSLQVLGALSEVLSVSIATFFPDAAPNSSNANSLILRKSHRPAIAFWGTGISKEVLTPPSPHNGGQLVTYMMYLEPQGHSGDEALVHEGLEAGVVLEGVLEIHVDETSFTLEQGDGFRFSSVLPHRFKNISSSLTRVLWVNYRDD